MNLEEIDEIMMKYLGMNLEEASYVSRGSYLNLYKYKNGDGKTPFLSPALVADIVREICEVKE